MAYSPTLVADAHCVLDADGQCTMTLSGDYDSLEAEVSIFADGAHEPDARTSAALPFAFRFTGGSLKAPGTRCTLQALRGSLSYRDCPQGTTVRVGEAEGTGAAGTLALAGPVLLAEGVELSNAFAEEETPVTLAATAEVSVPSAQGEPMRWSGPLVVSSTTARGLLGAEALERAEAGWPAESGARSVLAVREASNRLPELRAFGTVANVGDVGEIVRLRDEWRDAGSCGVYRVTRTDSSGVTSQTNQRVGRRARDIVADVFGPDGSKVATERLRGDAPTCPDSAQREGEQFFDLSIDGRAPWDRAWAWAEARASAEREDEPEAATGDSLGIEDQAPAARAGRAARTGSRAAPRERTQELNEPAGALGQAQIRGVLRRAQGALRRCYQRGAARDPQLAGRLTVRWRVTPAGAVQQPRVEADTLGSDPVRACVLQTVSSLRFPATAEGGEVRYPFDFRPS